MQVRISDWAWLPLEEFPADRLGHLKDRLTVEPRRTSVHQQQNPEPIKLFRERNGCIGVPRSFFIQQNRLSKRSHKIVDQTSMGCHPVDLKFNGELKEDQKRALAAVLEDRDNGSCGGIIQATPGWGKTVVALGILKAFGVPAIVTVQKQFLVDQWIERIKEFIPDARIGRVQRDKCEFGEDFDISVAMLQTLSSRVSEYPEEFWSAFGLLISDECVEGDALIETDEGLLPMREVVRGRSKSVLSFNESSQRWEQREIRKRWCKGKRRTVLIETTAGRSLRVTFEHLIKTEDGWVEAGKLREGDSILAPVSVGAAERFRSSMQRGVQGSTFWDTSLEGGLIGERERGRSTRRHRFVNVDAENASRSEKNRCDPGDYASGSGESISSVTTGGSRSLVSQRRREGLSWGRCWVILILGFHIPDLCRRVYLSITDLLRRNGLDTRPRAFLPFMLAFLFSQMVVTGKRIVEGRRCVILGYVKSIISYGEMVERWLRENGWIPSHGKGLLGGTWMTALSNGGMLSPFIPRVSGDLALTRLFGGCATRDIAQGDSDPRESTILSCFQQIQAGNSFRQSLSMQSPQWSTSFDSVARVVHSGSIDVFDIEVEGNHNFVANGLLVHNCHRVSAPTWASIVPLFTASYRIGLSATPRRKDGADDVFFLHLGGIIYKSKTKRVVPRLRRIFTPFKPVKTRTFDLEKMSKEVQLRHICKNPARNNLIVSEVRKAVEAGRKVILLSERRKHLELLKEKFDEVKPKGCVADFYVGGRKPAELEEAEDADVLFCTYQMTKEALDIPSLDTVFLTTPVSDVEQAVGRIMREYEGKKKPIVTDFIDEHVTRMAKLWNSRRVFYIREGMWEEKNE